MKKIFRILMIVLATCVATPVMTAQSYGKTEKEIKQDRKDAEKQSKKVAKDLKKQKWIYNGPNSLEDELIRYNLATTYSDGKRQAVVEDVTNAPSLYRGESMARSAAENDLVREIRSAIMSEIAEVYGNATGEYVEQVVEKWSKRVSEELNNDIKRHFYIYKQNPDKTFAVRVYFSKPDVIGSSAFKRQIKENIDFINDVKDSFDKTE